MSDEISKDNINKKPVEAPKRKYTRRVTVKEVPKEEPKEKKIKEKEPQGPPRCPVCGHRKMMATGYKVRCENCSRLVEYIY